MREQNQWRSDQKAKTREILQQIDFIAFTFDISGHNKGCTLDHLNGDYGYIKLKDAINDDWNIYDYETDKLIETFNSIEDIIAGGWKVST